MWPLTDITVYYDGTKIKDTPFDWEFRKAVNFISDYYHNSLAGYKPPKTGRICIHIKEAMFLQEPWYFGAICTLSTTMNEEQYLRLTKKEQYRYLLDLIHNTVMEAAGTLSWDKSVFESAYSSILNSDFVFEKPQKEKKSTNRKSSGVAVLAKTEDKASLKVRITTEGGTSESVLFNKKNWYWWDSSYKIAANCKWIDEDSFGYKSKTTDEFVYYSIREGKVKMNMNLEDSVF
ncbi:hypothetical protein [Rufibacter hautae]|uniref:Uncharacterized protein n=1 Tax=Rufibacter hautae TaxID=2595005 RepID=A0A5B6TCN7_9BACT|nr:hypothetical protein [Rufibacter hautae]KAA3437926.1 hypothetical protein FOA19_11625 [Rufibacter hautae]